MKNLNSLNLEANYDNISDGFTGILLLPSGSKTWYREGKKHREGIPAHIRFIKGIPSSNSWFLMENTTVP